MALLLTLAAVFLLSAGLANGSALLLVGSVAASLLAGVVLVVRVQADAGASPPHQTPLGDDGVGNR
jgi:hypothetical protein